MLLGKARGSVGDLTFSVSYGEQISRAKAKSVKNPRTDAQMIQRIIMATTVQAYSGMQAIVDHSFQGVAYQGPSMNKFNSLNSKQLRNLYATAANADYGFPTFNGNGMKTIALNDYIISTGSLPQVILPTMKEAGTGADVIITDKVERGESPNLIDGATGVAIAKASSLTYAQVISMFGLQAGDQLTLCALTAKSGDPAMGCQFKYGRFILMPADGDLSHDITDASVANEKNQNAKFVSRNITVDGSEMACQLLAFDDLDIAGESNAVYIVAAGVIVSRLEGNSWKRSNCQLAHAEWDDIATSYGYLMQDAIDSYSSTAIETNSPWYLNKAGKATTEEPAGVLQNGQIGFRYRDGEQYLVYKLNDTNWNVVVSEGADKYLLHIENKAAIGQTVGEAFEAGYVVRDAEPYIDSDTYNLTDVSDLLIQNATV